MADAEPTEACESPGDSTIQRKQPSQQHAAQELRDASTELVLKSNLSGTSRSVFQKLPREIEIMIWTEAMKEEARGTIVAYEPRNGGVYPKSTLVSTVSKVNRLTRTIGNQFYNVKLDVFTYYYRNPGMTIEPCLDKGVLRLNMEYTTLVLGLDYATYHESLLTEPIECDQSWKVKRIYAIEPSPKPAGFVPPCCWTCTWRRDFPQDDGPFSLFIPIHFNGVQTLRALFTSPDLDQAKLADYYCYLNSKDLWDKIKRNLVTAGGFPDEGLSNDYDLDREYQHVHELE